MHEFRPYPKVKYHPDKGSILVESADEEKKLGMAWSNSPADFGIETCPGAKPDPEIAKRKKASVGK